MTSRRSQGINPFFLKRQQEAEALRQQKEAQQLKDVSPLKLRGSKSHLPIHDRTSSSHIMLPLPKKSRPAVPEPAKAQTILLTTSKLPRRPLEERVEANESIDKMLIQHNKTMEVCAAHNVTATSSVVNHSPNAADLGHQTSASEGGCSSVQNIVIRIINHTLNLSTIEQFSQAEVELKWTEETGSSNTDLESMELPVNPPPYDTPTTDSLPFDHDNNILLAKFDCHFGRKFLWLCCTSQTLFWLVGHVPNTILTWRESMLRRCKLELKKKNNADGTVLFNIAKRFWSMSPTMEDIMEQNTRAAGATKSRKCVLAVDKNSKTPLLQGITLIPNSALLLQSHQRVLADPKNQQVRMGEGILSNIPAVPTKVSVIQICKALPALGCALPPTPHHGDATLIEAMMDVDNAVFAMSADTNMIKTATSATSIIKILRNVISSSEQASNTMLIPSGEWQRLSTTGPTVRPVNGGYWWQLPSPKHTKEPLKVWVHSPKFVDVVSMKSASMEVADALFEEFDPGSHERSTKLYLENTQYELKVPGGFLFPLALSVMISRLGDNVTIFLETFSNKSHGMRLNGLELDFGHFGTENWANKVATGFAVEWKKSILQMMSDLTNTKSECFKMKPDHSSIGFGFSTSYHDSSHRPLFSVCKSEEWMATDGYESFCTMALHSLMSPHTTHFQKGLILRVQAYIEAMNSITDRQCGSRKSLYTHIGFSALQKIASGEINVSAVLEGFNDDFVRINNAMKAMEKSPRNRTEIQVKCILDATGSLKLSSMMQAAADIINCSTQHWKLGHILSYSSINAASMFLIAQQSWRLACDVNVALKHRQLLLDIADEILKRWHSFKIGRGDGTTGPKNNRTLMTFPKLYEPLLSHLDSMLPCGKRFCRDDERIQMFTDHDIVTDTSFGPIMNKRIEENKNSSPEELSSCILKCCTCGKLFYGTANSDSLEVHHANNPSCVTSDWAENKLVTTADWESDYVHKLRKYLEFLKSCSPEQKEACESILKFGSGILAVGIAGAGKSFALDQVGMILECIFYKPGEIFRCAPTGLLALDFNSAGTTVHSAIGAHPPFGAIPDWNLSVQGWRDLIQGHGKITSNLKVFINTEVYAQSSNMLQALFEIRKEKRLNFVAILDGDPPQPMHEDEKTDNQANLLLCGISDHFLLNRVEIRRLLPDVRVINFETPMRQKDPKVHEFSTAVRYAKAERRHIQMMRDNNYDPTKHKVDIILCALRKDAARINIEELKKISGKEHQYCANQSSGAALPAIISNLLILKVGAPVIFNKKCSLDTTDKQKGKRQVVNGARGIVVSCGTTGVVVALRNTKVSVRVEPVELYGGKNIVQLPIQLGWAITIKKTAGMTFDTVAIDFGFDWTIEETNLVQCAMQTWRTSQAYGAITRPRKFAYFCHAHLFKDTVMLALLNNQNFAALQFLKNLTDFQEQYVQTRQDLRSLSLRDDDEKGTNPVKKRRFQTCKLLELTAFGDSSVTDHIWAHQHPQTLARQAAGTYCTGVLTGSLKPGKKVLVKSSNQQKDREIQALKELAGTYGVPELLGTSGEHLVLSHNGAVPHHGLLKQDHINDIQRIIDAMHAKGWTLEYITRQNIWSDAESVTLYNFENAVPTREARQLMTIHDFVQACDIGCIPCSGYTSSITSNSQLGVQKVSIEFSSVGGAYTDNISDNEYDEVDIYIDDTAPSKSNVIIHPKHDNSALKAWKREDNERRLRCVSKLWTDTHTEVFPKLGRRTWEEGMSFREGSRGYGEASPAICLLMLDVLNQLSTFQSRRAPSQTFVDIGSGLSNIVLQMSALQPDFKYCFGIEMEPPRAAFAMEACNVFTTKASKQRIPFCQIQAKEGDCFQDECCKRALSCAGLVWINNEIFSPADNLRLLNFLNAVVPVHCIIMSFAELVITKRKTGTTPQSQQPTDFRVYEPRQLQNICSWADPEKFKSVFIIQRKTMNFADQAML